MVDTTRRPRIIIIGGGLSGTCLANGLINKGIDVTVYERLREDAKREGYQIRLGGDALKGMRQCLTPEHLQQVVSKFGPASGANNEAPLIKDHNFKTMLDLTMFPSYNKSAPIARLALRDTLAAPVAASGNLKYGKRFEKYEIVSPGTVDEKVRVWFKDGGSDECDILVGADGNHSKINKQIGLNNIEDLPQFTNMLAKGQLSASRLSQVSPRVTAMPVLAFAKGTALYHCAYLPSQDGVLKSIDEANSFSMFSIHLPSSSCPADLAQRPKGEKWEFVRKQFSSWSSEYREMIDLASDSDPYFYGARASSNPGLRWRDKVASKDNPELGHSRVWLMGDTIHAMLPNRGMGGNTAMRDTAVILPLLEDLALSADPLGRLDVAKIASACRLYEAEMIPRSFAWVAKSGGKNLTPIDASTLKGRFLLAMASVFLQVSYYVYAVAGMFTNRSFVDQAPELR